MSDYVTTIKKQKEYLGGMTVRGVYKKLLMSLAVCLAVPLAWGKSFSIDLRQPTARGGGRLRAQFRAPPAAADESGCLRRVNLDARSADVGQVTVGDELVFTLFNDVSVTLTLKEQEPSPLGGDVFLAEASGYGGVKNAVVMRMADGLTVDIQDYLNKRVYKVISTATGVAVQELEAKAGKCGCDARVPPNLTGTATVKPHKAKKVVAAKNAGPGETCVDILVAYEQNAAAWAKSNGGGVTNFAQMAVQKMNTVLANNWLDGNFRFRLVGVCETSASSADLDHTLDSVTDGTGDWASIKMKRDAVGADIVTVLIDTGTDEGTTGLGWSLETTDFDSFSESAYNVCAIRSVAMSHTMTHEVGHNMGCGHSDVQKTQPGPQLYGYSAGYYFSVGDDKFHTIMAYGDEGPGGIEVPYFSSPYSYYEGVAVGDNKHDNGSTLANTCTYVSKWREEKGIDIGGGDDVPTAPLEWLTSRDEVFAKAKVEGKNVFLIRGSDTCLNTMGTKNSSCEDPFVKRYLLRDYICWYKGTEWEEANGYFDGFDVGSTMPSIAIIDVEKDETLVAGGGYHTVTDLRVMLGCVAKEDSFSPESGSRFRDSVIVTLSAASGAAIYYTLDGSDPSAGSSICYDKPITLTKTTTIRAVTFADGVWGLPVDAEFSKSRTEMFGGYEWTANVVDGGCVIVSVTPEPSGDIVMPVKIEGLDVIGFDAEVFKGNKNLTTLVIPDSVVEIPEYAFESCEKLSAVTIGAGVERIGAYAFGWTGLETIGIPASVTNIGVRAFTGCYDMTAVTVDPANGHYSSKDGFMYDKTLKHLLYCPGALRYVEIPQGVTHIGLCAFSDSNIERVVIPKTVVEIGASAFIWCGQLKSVVIPESVTNIGYSAFNLCWWLTDAYLPKSLESDYIQYDSFDTQAVGLEVTMHYYSGALKQVAVHFDANGGELECPNQMLELAENRIVGPSTLPVPMKTGHAFLGWFTAVDGGNEFTMDTVVTDSMTLYAHWEEINYSYCYKDNGDGTVTLSQYDKDGNWVENPIDPVPVGRFIVPEEIDGKRVVVIEDGFFSGCSEMTSVCIPSGVTNLNAYGFAHLYALKEIIVADVNTAYRDIDGVLYTKDGKTLVAHPRAKGCRADVALGTERIGEAAFYDNDDLASVTFPEGLKIIEDAAFMSCQDGDFTSITIPASVTSIGKDAFHGCSYLETVIFLGDESSISIADTTFAGTPYDTAKPFSLIVDEWGNLVGIHGTAPVDLVLADYLNGQALTGIGYEALSSWKYGMSALKSVVVPEGVTTLDGYAFASDMALESVTLPNSLQRINWGVFNYCTSLRTIWIPAGVTYVGDAFYGCTNLAVTAPSTLRDTFSVPEGCTIEYYDVSQYTVTFNANGGTVDGLATTVWTVNEGCRLDSADEYHDYYDLPMPTLNGHSFLGWFTAAEGGSRVSADTVVTGSVIYYAHWTADDNGSGNGGSDNGGGSGNGGSDNGGGSGNGGSDNGGGSGNGDSVGGGGSGTPQLSDPAAHAFYDAVNGAAPTVAALYEGYLCDGAGNVKGTIQVKVGKPGKKDGLAAVSAVVVGLDGKKTKLKATEKGKAMLAADGPTTVSLAGGDACEVTLGAKGMSGTYGAYVIDGSLNVFASKDAADKSVAAATLDKWKGAVNVAWQNAGAARSVIAPYQTLSVTIAAKGKAKVTGTLADGTKVSASGQLIVGENWCCVPVVCAKKGVSLQFAVWLPKAATSAAPPVVVGLGEDVKVGKPGTLKGGAAFRIDEAAFEAVLGKALLPYLPDGLAVTGGAKWTLPKAGSVTYAKGTTTVDAAKAGENPSGLKLTYKAKDGTFKGSFKAYTDVGGKPKATTVNVTGVLVDGVGYGAATVKKVGGVSVKVE